jgi:uncharacterized membrane protein YdjX (TVP38/TMEM64 family)
MSRRAAVGPPQLLAVLSLVIVFGGALWLRSSLGIEWSIESVRSAVEQLGVWAPIGFVLMVAFRSPLLLPSQLVLTVGGLAFGTLQGAVFGALGLLLAGTFTFLVARWLGAERLRHRVPPGLRRTLEAGGSAGGAAVVAVATGYPIGPITLVHAAAAVTGMSFASFLVAASVGSGMRAILYAYFGSSLIEGSWLNAGVAASVAAISLLPLLHPAVRRWLRELFAPPRP